VIAKKPYNARCDIWGLGVVIFVLLSGTPPFYHQDNIELFGLISSGVFEFHTEYWTGVSENAKDFIRGLLKVDPE
jgi:serine/threonine protein kinase